MQKGWVKLPKVLKPGTDIVYEAAILDSDRPAQRGLDSWHLMKREGRWWVVSVVNESEPGAGAIPGEVFLE